MRFGIRLHTITRDTSEEAWAEADRLLAGIDPETDREGPGRACGSSESEGQRRMLELNGGSKDDLEIYPNLWAGVGLVRGGAGTALVGSHERGRRPDRGVRRPSASTSSSSPAYPHLEGAYWFGEGVLPILAERGLWEHPRPAGAPHHAVPFARRRPRERRLVTGAPRSPSSSATPSRRRARSPPRTHLARELRRRRARPGRRPRRPRRRRCSTGPTRRSRGLVERGRRGRPGRRRLPDVQGDLHRPAQAVPRPLRPTGTGLRGRRRTADARRRARPRPGPRADAAPGADRDRRRPCRCAGLYVLDAAHDDPAAYADWLAAARPVDRRPARRPRQEHPHDRHPHLTTNQDLDPTALREAFGVFPSGVVAVAAEVDGAARSGWPPSSFTSVSLDPPLVSFSIANTSKTWPDLRRAGHLGVTILADHHGEVCRQLAGPVEHRFDGVAVTVDRRRRGHPRRGPGPLRLHDLPRGRGRRPHRSCCSQLHAVEQRRHRRSPLVFHRSGFGRLAAADPRRRPAASDRTRHRGCRA